MFTVVTVTLGCDWLVSDSTLVFAPNVLRFPKVVADAAGWMNRIDPSETFALFKQMLKTSDEKEKSGFLCLMGRSTDFL